MGNIVTVNFHGTELYGFGRDTGVFVALKPIVEAMGVDWSSQHKRVQRDPILSEGMVVMTIPFGRGGAQEATCLRLDLVHGWLFTIDSARIRDEAVRDRVLVYQRECYGVLAQHFLPGKPAGLERDPRSEESVAIRRMLVTEARHTFDIRAARELWFQLGLPVTPQMKQAPDQGELFPSSRSVERDETRDAA